MWLESFSLSIVNLEEKNYYSSRDIEFFLGVTFFGAPCMSSTYSKSESQTLNLVEHEHIWFAVKCERSSR